MFEAFIQTFNQFVHGLRLVAGHLEIGNYLKFWHANIIADSTPRPIKCVIIRKEYCTVILKEVKNIRVGLILFIPHHSDTLRLAQGDN